MTKFQNTSPNYYLDLALIAGRVERKMVAVSSVSRCNHRHAHQLTNVARVQRGGDGYHGRFELMHLFLHLIDFA